MLLAVFHLELDTTVNVCHLEVTLHGWLDIEKEKKKANCLYLEQLHGWTAGCHTVQT